MRRAVMLGVAFAMFPAVSLVAASLGARIEAATATTSPETTMGPPVAGTLPVEQVSYCHRTDSVIKPYVLLTTDVDAVVRRGHGGHTGPVFPEAGPGQNGEWGDIIPPFDYDNGQGHFPGLNWPGGSAVLQAGCAVHYTVEPPAVTSPKIVVNVSCRATMNLDVTYNEEPPSPWTLIVFIDGVEQFRLPDDDTDLMGFHPKIAADQLPQVSYTYSVNATNAGQTFTGIASGNVVCQTDPPGTTEPGTTEPGTTEPGTTEPGTTEPGTTEPGTTQPPTSTSPPPTGTSTTTPTTAATTTSAPSTSATTTTPGQSTTTAVASGPSGTTTTSVPAPTGTPPPTAAPTPLDPPPVAALPPGEVLSDPPPQVLSYVVVPGSRMVDLGLLSPEQVRVLFRELAQRKLAHTGNDTGVLVLAASLSLVSGGALVGLARRPRRRAA